MKISAVIIAGNEQSRIADAVRSVGWADEALVIDSESTDDTAAIAESLGAKVIVRPWAGFAAQKQFGVDAAENDWVFSLDADEIVSDGLIDEIATLKNATDNADGYRIPRISYYMGRKIMHSGWYPDWQLRLFDRSRGRWSDSLIHESWRVADGGRVAKLNNAIIHHSVENAAHHHQMIGERYAPLAARQMFESGRRTTAFKVKTAGLTAFISTYFLKRGFLDGFPGFCIAKFAGHHAYLKHLMLWEMQNDETVGHNGK